MRTHDGPSMTALPRPRSTLGGCRGLWRLHRERRWLGQQARDLLGDSVRGAAGGGGAFRRAPAGRAVGTGVRDCFAFGATSQRRSPWDPPRIPEPSIWGPSMLNVNVTTPNPSRARRLPVLVWIHGGGFIAGSPASPWYGGQSFARDGVVTVAISYRARASRASAGSTAR